jgi:hypothetical protein
LIELDAKYAGEKLGAGTTKTFRVHVRYKVADVESTLEIPVTVEIAKPIVASPTSLVHFCVKGECVDRWEVLITCRGVDPATIRLHMPPELRELGLRASIEAVADDREARKSLEPKVKLELQMRHQQPAEASRMFKLRITGGSRGEISEAIAFVVVGPHE